MDPPPSDTILGLPGLFPPEPTPPPTILLSEILASQEALLARETEDKSKLEAIGQIPLDVLRAKLIAWAVAGFPNSYSVHDLTMKPPAWCSDGVVRDLSDYIKFCSGKPLFDHLAGLQATLPDITVGFTFSAPTISIVVIKQ